mgnify:CR=1 FL=1
MTKQKKGFLLFICSLIPGAGELYMGFRKQGLSIMLLFWGCIFFSGYSGIGFFVMFLPILWAYSFFNVHNLKSLSEEDFYSVEDAYILHMDQFIDNTDHFVRKYKKIIAILLIIFGVSILWDNVTDLIRWILPEYVVSFFSHIFYTLPSIIIAIVIIAGGVHLLKTKKLELDDESEKAAAEKKEEEHYWEPYRPYQQTVTPETEVSVSDQIDTAPEQNAAPSETDTVSSAENTKNEE